MDEESGEEKGELQDALRELRAISVNLFLEAAAPLPGSFSNSLKLPLKREKHCRSETSVT